MKLGKHQPPKPQREPTIWSVKKFKGWGNRISWYGRTGDGKEHMWFGWTTPRPQLGDIIETEMQSGRIDRFTIISLKLYIDPDDMWYAHTSVVPDGEKPYGDQNP